MDQDQDRGRAPRTAAEYDRRAAELYEAGDVEGAQRLFAQAQAMGLGDGPPTAAGLAEAVGPTEAAVEGEPDLAAQAEQRDYELEYFDVLQRSHRDLLVTLGREANAAELVTVEAAKTASPEELDDLIDAAKARFATDLAELTRQYDQRAADLYEAGQPAEAERLFAKARHLGLQSELKTQQDRDDFSRDMLARWQTTPQEPLTNGERSRINEDLQARFEAGSSIRAVGRAQPEPARQGWLQRRMNSVRQARETSQSFGMSIER